MARVAAFHEAMWSEPAHDVDVGLLAEICFREFWPGCDLAGFDSDALLHKGPHNGESGAKDKALGALLKAIREQDLASLPDKEVRHG